MSPRHVIRIATRYLLIGCLLAINIAPFVTAVSTPYTTIFMLLSGIHAEICLLVAWTILADPPRRNERRLWSGLGLAAALLAGMRLLPGKWTVEYPWASILLGVGGTVPALLPIAVWFGWRRFQTGQILIVDTAVRPPGQRYRLRKLFLLTAACALLSLQLRQTVHAPDGWLASPPNADVGVMTVGQSLVIGMLVAPCASIIIAPSRWSVLYVAYFLAVISLTPFLEQGLTIWFAPPVGFTSSEWIWQDSYPALVMDNTTWYAPQLLPTVGLFVLLRLAGGRLEKAS